MTFVWAGQGLIGTVLVWAPPELAGRIRTGDAVIDLLWPLDLVGQQLASDLGRAGFAMGVRFAVPVAVGTVSSTFTRPSGSSRIRCSCVRSYSPRWCASPAASS
jgi:ABC-2 type transport system permease protein